MNINQQYIQFLMFLEMTTNCQIFYEKNEKTFIKRVGGEYLYLEPRPDCELLDISEMHLVSLKELYTLGDLPDFYRAITTQKPQLNHRITTQEPQNNHQLTTTKPEFIRKNTGKIPQIFYKIQETENDEINVLIQEVEILVKEILKKTNDKTTIITTKKEYEQFEKAVKTSDITKLYTIKAGFETRLGRQDAPNNMKKTIARRIKNIRIFLSSAAVILLGVGLYFFIQSKKSNNAIEISENQTIIEKRADIENLIRIFCTQKDTALTEYRITYILQNIPLPETEDVVIEKINHFAIYGN